MNYLNSNRTSDKGPENIIILEPPECFTPWTMNQRDLQEPQSSDLDDLFNEEYSNILDINEDNLGKLIVASLYDNCVSNDKVDEQALQTVPSIDNISEVFTTTDFKEDNAEVNSTNVTSEIIFPNASKPNAKKSMTHLIESSTKDKIEISEVFTTSDSEEDKTEVNSTNVTSEIIFQNTSKPNDKKSMIHLIESSTKDKIVSIDFSCQKCKLVNLLCKACITKTKKKRKTVVNTMKRSFPKIYHRFINIFVTSAIFDITKIV